MFDEKRWEFIALGKWNGQTSGYAFGLRIPLPAGNKFPSFPQTCEVLIYYVRLSKGI